MRAQAQRASARPRLADALRKPVSLNFKSQPVVQILEAISKIAGVDFVLDPEVAASAPATIIADQTTAEDAINLLLRTSKLEKKVLSERSLLIYPASAEKSKEYRELMVRVFYLSNAQAAKVVPALRQVGTIKNVHLDERANALIVRDTPEVIAVAERIVAALDLAQSEVTMDVRVLEVNTNDELEVGVDYPSDLRLSILPQGESGKVTVGDILGLNSEMLGVSSRNELSMALNLLQKRGKTRVLANPKIRVRNMEKASIKIGEKVPVVTTTNANGVVTESVNYQDVGLSLQVEPQVTLGNDVSVKVSMEVSNLKGEVKTAGGGVVHPMSTRNAETVMTARDGETQVLAGLVNQKQSGNTSGLPGLSTLEWLGSLFGSTKDSEESTEIVLLLTPHVERSLELPAASNSYFPSGTEASVTVLPLTTAPARPAGRRWRRRIEDVHAQATRLHPDRNAGRAHAAGVVAERGAALRRSGPPPQSGRGPAAQPAHRARCDRRLSRGQPGGEDRQVPGSQRLSAGSGQPDAGRDGQDRSERGCCTSCACRRIRCASPARARTRPTPGRPAATTVRPSHSRPAATCSTCAPAAKEKEPMASRTTNGRRACAGFTLIELLAVMAIVGVLTALVAPSFFKSNDRARETVLRHNLRAIRLAIDDYRADHGVNPEGLEKLVSGKYLRELPLDPLTGKRDSWKTQAAEEGGVADVKSGAPGKGLDGSSYEAW